MQMRVATTSVSRRSVVCRASTSSSQWQQLATAAVTASLLLSPVGAAEAARGQQLADLLRDDVSMAYMA
jgi:hypothetical protein